MIETRAPAFPAAVPGQPDLSPTPDAGLTDEEVGRRRAAGLGNTAPLSTTRTYAAIIRENVFTFINNILFLLGLALVAVGRPVDALVSLSVIMTNVVVGIVQEIRAKRTLDRIVLLTRPTAAVIRNGELRHISPDDLVLGDLLELAPGDQVVLDGHLVSGAIGIDESQLTGESDVVRKRPGDEVFSGSFSTTGTGRYVAEKVQQASFANQITAGARSFRRVITPLQGEINLVIRVVLGIVIYLEILLVIRGLVQTMEIGEVVADATLLAGLVPNGLFVSIAVAYALGAVRIIRFGALVQQSNAIESLSHVDVLCLDKTGTLTANALSVDSVAGIGGASEDEVIAAAAVLAASATSGNKTSEAIAKRWPTAPGRLSSEVPFSSARKWSAVALAEGSVTGVVALGAPTFLHEYLAHDETGEAAGWEELRTTVAAWTDKGLRVLLVATHPDASALQDPGEDETAARLPDGMRPLGLVALADELRAEAAETLAIFRASGVAVKIISGDDPETVAALARQAGLGPDIPLLAGPQLEAMDDIALRQAATDTVVFGRITPAQKERLVDALRAGGHYVAMIGDGVNDVLSLKKANLAIAMGSGSQATRGVADLVLMQDSFAAVAKAVIEGQRILNGMQDILKLFLTRIMTVGLVIMSSLVVVTFPIELRNASALTVFTVGIPTALLAVWAQPGHRIRDSLGRTLARFVVPAAVGSSLIGLVLFVGLLFLGTEYDGKSLEDSLHMAQTALTSFLVYAGLLLVIFVEPPVAWFAVAEPITPDRRPTFLALGLAIGYLVVLQVPLARGFFQLVAPDAREGLFVLLAVIAWLVMVRTFWARKVVERFLGF
ncbi:MAG TPA: HAD-IC family P-type ATPase [Candidatus Limnocylindrales bacterium]|nr:HAD-IC family P-type ATPase [Candidatus Limnocylindrales bacterium]